MENNSTLNYMLIPKGMRADVLSLSEPIRTVLFVLAVPHQPSKRKHIFRIQLPVNQAHKPGLVLYWLKQMTEFFWKIGKVVHVIHL